MTEMRPLKEWRARGVTLVGGRALPASSEQAALVAGERRQFLVSANYDALLGYNCAHAYALTVGLLADRLETDARR
jgi:glucose-6-phosphate 1-epimerase